MPSTSKPAAEKKLWGGRFTGDTDPLMVQFNESLPIDKRMWKEDIQVESLPGSMLCSWQHRDVPGRMCAVLHRVDLHGIPGAQASTLGAYSCRLSTCIPRVVYLACVSSANQK